MSRGALERALVACRRMLVLVGAFSLALNLLMLSVPLYMAAVYDRALTSHSVETLLMITLVAVGALVLVAILDAARQMILLRTGARLEAALGGPVLAASLMVARGGSADVQGLRDLMHLRQFVASPLVGGLFDAPMAPFYLALLFLIHPHLGWLALGAAILILLVSLANQRLTRAPLVEAEHSA